MKTEVELKTAMRKSYLQLHGRAIKSRAGNPELKFMQPETHWAPRSRFLATYRRGRLRYEMIEPYTPTKESEKDEPFLKTLE